MELSLEGAEKTNSTGMHDIDIIVEEIDLDPDESGKRVVAQNINLTETDYSI